MCPLFKHFKLNISGKADPILILFTVLESYVAKLKMTLYNIFDEN
jgi:hypothetical protein